MWEVVCYLHFEGTMVQLPNVMRTAFRPDLKRGRNGLDRDEKRLEWIAAAAIFPVLSYLVARYVGLGPLSGPWAYWPINGILCGIFYRRAYRDWPVIAVVAAAAQILTIYLIRGDLAGGATIVGALVGFTQAMLGTLVLRWACDDAGPLEDVRDLGWFVGASVCLIPLLTSSLSGLAYSGGLRLPFPTVWVPLFAGNSLSILLFAPPVMYVWRRDLGAAQWRAGTVELILGSVVTVGAAAFIFSMPPHLIRFAVVPYALIPILAWTAARCGPVSTSLAIVAIGTIAAWCTARGLGPFGVSGVPFEDRTLHLQAYLALLALTGILLSALWEQRRRTYDQLAIQAEIRDRFIDSSVNPSLLKDTEGRTIVVNSAYASLAGRSKDDLIGGTIQDHVMPREAELMRSRDRMVIEHGTPMSFDEAVVVSGRRRQFVVTRFPVKDSAGEIRYLGVIARDVTDERELTERLFRAQRVEVIGNLAAGIAHDLNNLLSTVLLNIELLGSSEDIGSQDREIVGELKQAGSRAAKLTDRLLALGRQKPPDAIELVVDDAIRELIPMLNVLVRGEVELKMALNALGATILADPVTAEQVVLNLISNARDAIVGDGTITLSTEIVPAAMVSPKNSNSKAGTWVRMRITDTGSGMDTETVGSLFEPFFSTKGQRGTGLGLYTTSLLIRQAGGEIAVTSRPGEGSTFIVDFPTVE